MTALDQIDTRYQVRRSGTRKRPFEVWDTLGGWVCSAHSVATNAYGRADELNRRDPRNPSRHAVAFFAINAGGCKEADETWTESIGRNAAALAQAEEWARAHGYRYEWNPDDLAERQGDMVCVMLHPDNEEAPVVQSLGGIEESEHAQERADYRRLVQAELALEEYETPEDSRDPD